MVEHDRSQGSRSRNTVEREPDLPEIEFGTLTLIGFLGNEHFTVAPFCMPPGYLAFDRGITQRGAGCEKMPPDEFGSAPLFLRFLTIPFEDAMD